QASTLLSVHSFTVVRSARCGLSNPRILRFRPKNSATEISRCFAASCWAIVGGGDTDLPGVRVPYKGRVGIERVSEGGAGFVGCPGRPATSLSTGRNGRQRADSVGSISTVESDSSGSAGANGT